MKNRSVVNLKVEDYYPSGKRFVLTWGAPEWRLASQHFPKRDTKRVQIRQDYRSRFQKFGPLFRIAVIRCPNRCGPNG
jgi:hypothetical protein